MNLLDVERTRSNSDAHSQTVACNQLRRLSRRFSVQPVADTQSGREPKVFRLRRYSAGSAGAKHRQHLLGPQQKFLRRSSATTHDHRQSVSDQSEPEPERGGSRLLQCSLAAQFLQRSSATLQNRRHSAIDQEQKGIEHRRHSAGTQRLSVSEDAGFNAPTSSLISCRAKPFDHKSLAAAPFFQDRDPKFLQLLLETIKLEIFLPGSDIVREGENGDTMYFLNRGEVEVLVGPDAQRIAELKDGSVFGEMALLGDGRRKATIRATEICDCRTIHAKAFNKCLTKFPKEQEYFLDLANDRMDEIEASQSHSKNEVTKSLLPQSDGSTDSGSTAIPSTCMEGFTDAKLLGLSSQRSSGCGSKPIEVEPLEEDSPPSLQVAASRGHSPVPVEVLPEVDDGLDDASKVTMFLSQKRSLSKASGSTRIPSTGSDGFTDAQLLDLSSSRSPSSRGSKPIEGDPVEEGPPSSLQVAPSRGHSPAPDEILPEVGDAVDDAVHLQCQRFPPVQSLSKHQSRQQNLEPGAEVMPVSSQTRGDVLPPISHEVQRYVEENPNLAGFAPTKKSHPTKVNIAGEDMSGMALAPGRCKTLESKLLQISGMRATDEGLDESPLFPAGVAAPNSTSCHSVQKIQPGSVTPTEENMPSKSKVAPLQGNYLISTGKVHDVHEAPSPKFDLTLPILSSAQPSSSEKLQVQNVKPEEESKPSSSRVPPEQEAPMLSSIKDLGAAAIGIAPASCCALGVDESLKHSSLPTSRSDSPSQTGLKGPLGQLQKTCTFSFLYQEVPKRSRSLGVGRRHLKRRVARGLGG